jgi:bacillithiol biosynthesis cysteine-adding enzyme BshC
MDSITYDRIPHTKKLFADYVSSSGRLHDFFTVGPVTNVPWPQLAAMRADRAIAERRLLIEALYRQNSAWGCAAPTLANIEKLESPDTVSVVTGQQAGLLTGPLYTIYKAFTTIKLARQLIVQQNIPVVPVFWLVADDHDWDEISGVSLTNRDGELSTITYRPEEVPAGDAVYTVKVEPTAWDEFLSGVHAALPETEFKESVVMRLIRECYQPGESVVDGFARLFHQLFAEYGVVLMDVTQDNLKRFAQPIFQRELENPLASTQLVAAAGRELETLGYHAQIEPNAHGLNLFVRKYGKRNKIEYRDGLFSVAEERLSPDVMRQWLIERPADFSTGVALRPILQDSLLPTVAYVAGPGETAYFAQLKKVYEFFDVPMPAVFPRAGLTVIEQKIGRIMEKHHLTLEQAFLDHQQLASELVRTGSLREIEEELGRLNSATAAALVSLEKKVAAIDPTLSATVRAAQGKLSVALEAVRQKTQAALKRGDETLVKQVERFTAALYPGGELQERTLNVMQFLNLYGMDFMKRVEGALDVDSREHGVMRI